MLKNYDTAHGPVRWAIAMVDILFIIVCMAIAHRLAFAHHPQTMTAVSLQKYIIAAIVAYIPAVAFFRPILMYRVVRGDLIMQRTLNMCILHILFLLALLFIMKDPLASREVFVLYGIFIALAITIFRLTSRHLVNRIRKSGHNVRHALLAGPVADVAELNAYLAQEEYGIDILGIFTSSSEEQCGEYGIKRLGAGYELLPYLQNHEKQVDALFCAVSSGMDSNARQVFSFCENHLIRYHIVPAVASAMSRTLDTLYMGDTLLLTPRKEPLLNIENRVLKRTLDLMCSGIFLLTVFPIIYIVVAVIIKLKSPGPVFSVQERTGWNKHVFRAVTFRTTPYDKGVDTQLMTERDFPFGDFMHRSHLGELPLFINIFLGSMSLVGPRPYTPSQNASLAEMADKYNVHLCVKPGITGWDRIQDFHRDTRQLSTTEQRVKADIWYVENWTFWLDMRIICHSLFCSTTNKINNT